MPLPLDLVLVRHGESEGNVAVKASKKGDDSFFTPEFRNRHSREFKLTDLGIKQAKSAGVWLRENLPFSFTHFYVSDYIRAKETAYNLQLQNAEWREEFQLRERDMALMDNIPEAEKQKLFEMERKQHELDPFLSFPAGGGESVANLCLRVRAEFLEHLARQRSEAHVVAVCHGHVMRALQLEIENLGHDDFIRLDKTKKLSEKIRNCQILWYSRRDPNNSLITNSRTLAVKSVCPWDSNGDYEWRYIERKLLSNDDLRNEVSRYRRHAN